MRFIGTKLHGVMDYLVSVLLMVSPWLFRFYRAEAESWVPFAIGLCIMLYSFFTNYELGVKKAIPVHSHLNLDFLAGLVLATSPWIFGFAAYVYLPHLIIGLGVMAAALTTKKIPFAHHEPVSA